MPIAKNLERKHTSYRRSKKRYFLPTVKIENYNVKIDGKILFNKPIENTKRTFNSIRKITNSQRNDHTASCLLDYLYFSKEITRW